MRAIVMGRAFAIAPLLAGVALAALQIVLAAGFFVYLFRYAVRSGLLARYSAESVS
jgi:ABC-2 type transport system permease protein